MGRIALILAGFSLWTTGAAAQEAANEAPVEGPAAELKALAETCSAHRFETMVVVDGSGRAKKVKICGEEGQSDADWLVTLRDSRNKAAADENMAEAVKDQLVAALATEIERLEQLAAAAAPAAVTVATIDLPSQPLAVPEAKPQYSSVPPLPALKPRVAGASPTAVSAPVARPRLTLRCALPRESFAGCARLERETRLLIRADEDLASGISLRFLRGGEARAEFDLGSLRKGESLREKLPGRVCSGVLRGRVEVQVLSKGRVAQTMGPYNLYCGS